MKMYVQPLQIYIWKGIVMASRYIHFTDQQKEQARMTDIAELLRSQGETLKRSGSEYEWKDGSQKVTIRGNLWFHQYEQVGGDAIDFVRRFYNKLYPEAMEYLLGKCSGTLTVSPPIERKPPVPFELPQRNENMRRVYAYLLNRRGIDRDVLYAFAHKGMIYESAEYHNAVFVGYDQDGVPRHAHKRGSGSESSYKGNQPGSSPEYSFHWQAEPAPNSRTKNSGILKNNCPRLNNRLYLFEAPIDMLSFISMQKAKAVNKVVARENELRNAGIFERELAAAACRWQQHSYAASCGVSDQVLWQMLKDNPNIDTVFLCRDNDEAGQTANKRTSDSLFIKGIQHEILIPTYKDWNEDRLTAGGNAPHKEFCAEFSISEQQEENIECTLQQVM